MLKNLVKVQANGDEAARTRSSAGYGFYLEHLLDEDGLPLPFASRPRLTLHRRDLYDYAEGINLARLLHGDFAAARGVLARLVADLVDAGSWPTGTS